MNCCFAELQHHCDAVSQLINPSQSSNPILPRNPTGSSSSTESTHPSLRPQQHNKSIMSPGAKRAYETTSKAYELPVTTSAAPSKPSAKKKCDTNSKAVAKKKNNRNSHCDSNIKDSSSWSKLLSRHIKGDCVKQTVSTYAFDTFNVHRIVSVDKCNPVTGKRTRHKNNGTTRAFKCKTCPPDLWHGWSVMLRRVTDKKQNLWCVIPCVGNKNLSLQKFNVIVINLRNSQQVTTCSSLQSSHVSLFPNIPCQLQKTSAQILRSITKPNMLGARTTQSFPLNRTGSLQSTFC